MKTIKLLVTTLLVMLCMGFSSCSKDSNAILESPPLVIDPIDPNSIHKRFGLDPKLYKYVKDKEISTEETLIVGLKNKQIWMAIYNSITKKKLYELIDTEETKETITKYMGYGENLILRLQRLGIVGLVQTERGAVGLLDISYGRRGSLGVDQIHRVTFFKNENSIKKETTIIDEINIPPSTALLKWYKDAVMLGGKPNFCCNDKGDTLYTTRYSTDFFNYVKPVSYEEGILAGENSSRINYKTEEIVWKTKVKIPFYVPNDTRKSYSILDKTTNIWKCKIDLLYYDGTKKDFTFEINIENGAIIGQTVEVTGLSVNKHTVNLKQDETFQLITTIQPDNATNKNITWSSSNEAIAKVDNKGLVTAISEGTTTITATTEDGHFTVQTIVQVLSLKKIVNIKSEIYNTSFTYSNGKLNNYILKITDSNYEFNQTISYNNAKVIIREKTDENEYTQTYLLNKDGYATSCFIPDYEGKSVETLFEYSKEGYLTKAIEIMKYNSETESNSYSFTYSTDGNILNGKSNLNSGNIYTQSYGSVKNKSGIMDYAMSQLLFNYEAAFYSGILGKPCTHLPSSCKETEVYEMGWSRTYDFLYTQDDSGYVTKTAIADSQGNAKTLIYTYK